MSASTVVSSAAVPATVVTSQPAATYVTSMPTVTYAASAAGARYMTYRAPTEAVSAMPTVTYMTPEVVPFTSGFMGGSVSAVPMVASPAVYACPPEIFAKLAAGGALTPEEMAQLTGQAPAAPAVPEVLAALALVEVVAEAAAPVAEQPAAAVTSAAKAAKDKSASKKKSSKKKELLKASKKSKKAVAECRLRSWCDFAPQACGGAFMIKYPVSMERFYQRLVAPKRRAACLCMPIAELARLAVLGPQERSTST
eukprot:CAMPEP_0183434612 /NCGR_PEP_ID=MMETSP0370-20130417/64050_1 /TAXON_ID=268820 /ORGANISM="Peridinium aciculiferum, Strain PAER-2" /LENGTH=253 /DNA_ID=CAMNT_0025621349 /DNA_START=53 /DNA_END=811 /DNA_ORIENTATION=+